MAAEKLFYIGVKALIENAEGNVLLMKTIALPHSAAHWDIPGGRIQEGNSVEETLRREVTEETGITELSDMTFYTAVVSNIEIPVPEIGKAGLMLVVYKVSVPERATVVLSEEHTAYEWVNRQTASDRLRRKYPEQFTATLVTGGGELEST